MAERSRPSTRLNGEETDFLCEPRQSLLEVLRDELGLTGTKEGCNNGNCGACNVIMDGRLVNSCCVLGVEVAGREDRNHRRRRRRRAPAPAAAGLPRRSAALQCGICTPGFIVAAKALLDAEPNPSEHEIRFWLAGNLCRCTGYDKIVRAVLGGRNRDAAGTGRSGRTP